MIKNTASQVVGAQMVSATDGSAFTGSVTCLVTVDGGTQATGTVGSGACTHEGNGFHTYTPSQAETNGDHLAFTFIGSGAIPVTVQIYTRGGDAFTRLGAPAGASVSADIANVEGKVDDLGSRLGTPSDLGSGASIAANLADIESQTDDIGAAGAGLTAVPWNAPTADGAHPTLGIIDQGTAQSASSTGLVLRSGAAFGNDTLIGSIALVHGSDQGYWQARIITDNALSGDSVTVDPAWGVTPTGTITYKIFGAPPGSTTAPVPADLRAVMGNAFTGSTKPYDTSA